MSETAVNILLVEDNPDDLTLAKYAFEKAGLVSRLHVVADGAEAIEFIFCTGRYAGRQIADRPKVIFLDLKMPKVGGLEVLRRLKADRHMRTIPIVVLSSSQQESDLISSYDLGVNSYVVKPTEFDEFGKTIQRIGEYWLRINQTPAT